MADCKQYDLSLGQWGPYNKEFLGVCHIADKKRGTTFQVELFPSFFRRRVFVSNSVSDGGLKMWGANAELTRFVYRYEMEWKDRVFCDVDFSISKDKKCDISCTFVNNTDVPQSVAMNVCASLQRPFLRKGKTFGGYKTFYTPVVPKDCVYVDAPEYEAISCSQKLAVDGLYIGEQAEDCTTGAGTAINCAVFREDSHKLQYALDSVQANSIGIRAKAKQACFCKGIINKTTEVLLAIPASDTFEYHCVEFLEQTVESVELYPDASICIDCFVVGVDACRAAFVPEPNSVISNRKLGENSLSLSYEGISTTYSLRWQEPVQMIRRIYTDNIAYSLEANIHNHVSKELDDDGTRLYDTLISEPLFLEPHSQAVLRYTVESESGVISDVPAPIYDAACNPEGEKFRFSQNMMMYNTFLNVVYPIYTRRQYIRHNTPGRNWDCLYTWDSGFIGMGLGCGGFERAYECLYTYLTPVGDIHSPFVFHGSVVPTQIFLYQYLFDKYPQYRERLKTLFPMVMQYFRFFSQMEHTEKQMASSLLKTWHIFYNSGGWDDYPPQKYLQGNTAKGVLPSYENTTPVITTAITVLIAKILKNIALSFGENTAEFDDCIETFSARLHNGLFDEECGYFSYIVHNEQKKANGFLRYADGTNFNWGFDGIYPFISGITTPRQDAKILENIKKGLMTDIGVSVVDTRAPYYSQSGYWNGSVWMPHQWILWRALLDFGDGDLAYEIADKALNLWKNEVDNSYCCFEHFMSENGRGAGFHQFSGLSTPVMMFFEAYYKIGNLTVGFDAIIHSQVWNEEKTSLKACVEAHGKNPLVIVCMKAGRDYVVTVNGAPAKFIERNSGTYEIALPFGNAEIMIR